MLLERSDVNPEISDIPRRTPLLVASLNGYEGIVKMLLDRNDVNPNHRDLLGLTPLMWASLRGHEGVASMLSERSDAKTHKLSRWHRRLLWSLSWVGEREGRDLKMLLERQSRRTR